MYYAHYDNQTGRILGFYIPDIHGDNIPTPNIPLTYEQWQDCLTNQGLRKVDVTTKQIVTCEPPAPTKDQLLAQLDAEYQPQFAELSKALGLAILNDNQDIINDIKADYQLLKQEYQTKREEILND